MAREAPQHCTSTFSPLKIVCSFFSYVWCCFRNFFYCRYVFSYKKPLNVLLIPLIHFLSFLSKTELHLSLHISLPPYLTLPHLTSTLLTSYFTSPNLLICSPFFLPLLFINLFLSHLFPSLLISSLLISHLFSTLPLSHIRSLPTPGRMVEIYSMAVDKRTQKSIQNQKNK